MFKMIMNGYLGKMGKTIRDIALAGREFEIVGGVDVLPSTSGMPFPTFVNIQDCDMPADVIVDFSTASAVPKLLDYAADKSVPVVICTTGLSADTLAQMKTCAEKVAVFYSSNMSLGINLIASLLQKAAPILDDAGFDIEILEKHHNQKIDAPSGTAILLADAVNEALSGKLSYVHDRSADRKKRERGELGIHAVRGGTIVGEHTVLFAGKDETLEFTHIAQSKEVFAVGAVKAASFVKDKGKGLYNMRDLLNERLNF